MSTVEAVRSVPFFNYPKAFGAYEEQILDAVRDVLHRGAYIMQKDLVQFEENLANYLGVKHAIGVANATDGLILAWRAAGLPQGGEVIFPSHTMVASPAAVHFAGGVPVPVDCGPDGLLDPDAVRRAIGPNTKGIMPVQLNGRTCKMDEIEKIADEHGLLIVEDAAQGLGSSYKGRKAGSFGKAASFSFYPAKILGCMGDGGAVTTNDDHVAEQIKLMRDHGRDHSGDTVLWGVNSRLDNLQAAILDLQFKDYAGVIERRRAIATHYHALLGDLSELVLPPAPGSDPDHFDCFQNFEIQAERRDDLRTFLRERGIGTLIQWGGKAVHQFEKLGFKGSLPNTEAMFRKFVMLPMNMTLEDDDVAYVAQTVREFYGK